MKSRYSLRSLLLFVVIMPPLICYVWGYFWASERIQDEPWHCYRFYNSPGLALAYWPLAVIEGQCLGIDVETATGKQLLDESHSK